MSYDLHSETGARASRMSLFAELKRRNVLRVAAAYVAVAWLVIQVVETIFPAFGFGDAAIRGVVIFLAIGFLPAVISAWAFELTPEGFVRDSEVDRSSPTIRAMGKRLDRLIMVALALALGYFALDKFMLDPARDRAREQAIAEAAKEAGRAEAERESAARAADGPPMVAVLPACGRVVRKLSISSACFICWRWLARSRSATASSSSSIIGRIRTSQRSPSSGP